MHSRVSQGCSDMFTVCNYGFGWVKWVNIQLRGEQTRYESDHRDTGDAIFHGRQRQENSKKKDNNKSSRKM